MITNIVYSHTDYIDILRVHSDYLKFENSILFINFNYFNINEIYSKFKKVIFYDDKLSYSQRLNYCLTQIDEEYVLLTHDIDIPILVDIDRLNKIYKYCIDNKLDRIDLQYDIRIGKKIINSQIIETDSFSEIDINNIQNYYSSLVRNDDVHNFIYNVNPSIWRRRTLLELTSTFPYETYRTIEGPHVQQFLLKYKIYKLFTNKKMCSGYFTITPIYQFLHITHGGGLMPVNKEVNGADDSICEEYKKIIDNYAFHRPLMNSMF